MRGTFQNGSFTVTAESTKDNQVLLSLLTGNKTGNKSEPKRRYTRRDAVTDEKQRIVIEAFKTLYDSNFRFVGNWGDVGRLVRRIEREHGIRNGTSHKIWQRYKNSQRSQRSQRGLLA